jgi:hypothetical protein
MDDIYRRSKNRRPGKKGYVRVIRDVKNMDRDYYIPAERAKHLFEEGKLIQVQVYNSKWSYSTRQTHEYYE